MHQTYHHPNLDFLIGAGTSCGIFDDAHDVSCRRGSGHLIIEIEVVYECTFGIKVCKFPCERLRLVVSHGLQRRRFSLKSELNLRVNLSDYTDFIASGHKSGLVIITVVPFDVFV